jgi:tRNA nucleotidyltransferase/poly(A) polymerase
MSIWRQGGADDEPIFEIVDRVAGEQPLGKLAPQPWMTRPPTRELLDALQAGGAEVRFIGGCVRDAIARRPIRDIDLAMALTPPEVTRLLTDAGIKVIPTGVDHGTVTAIVEGQPFEITTLRVDVETDGRHAKVAFTDDWVADAARRDFTINALSCTPDGDVYDYFDGLLDLGIGRVRFVGNARERIGEDVLRLLRFFRFYGYYGRPPADAEALAACRDWADQLPTLSGERVRVEILRTLLAQNPDDVFDLMRETGVLEHVLPEASDLNRLRQVVWLEQTGLPPGTLVADPIRRLAAMVNTDAEGAARIAGRLRLSNKERDRVVTLAAPPVPIEPEAPDLELRHALQRLGKNVVTDLIVLAWAAERARTGISRAARTQAWQQLLDRARDWEIRAFPLRGRDVVAAGLPRGPDVGRVLAGVEAWWAAGGYRAGREDCLDHLRALIAGHGDAA